MGRRTKIKALLESEQTDIDVTVKGWVRSFRNNQFVALNDGSTNSNLQVVVDFENTDPALLKRLTTGTAISVSGVLVASLGKGQKVEVKAKEIEILGDCDPDKYPLQLKNRPSLEFLREIAHLRFRTNTFGAVFRVRNSLAYAVHQFFQERGFVYLHTPIITASDAEGAGETFRVTTLPIKHMPLVNDNLDILSEKYYKFILEQVKDLNIDLNIIDNTIRKITNNIFDFKTVITANDGKIRELKRLKSLFEDDDILFGFFTHLYKKLEGKLYLSKDQKEYYGPIFKELIPTNKDFIIGRRMGVENYPYLMLSFYNFKRIDSRLRRNTQSRWDFSQDFFGKATNLTVSGQLEGELGAMALSDIYTFGPTFRAENSNTTRHLAEFWMIEPEMAFYDLNDNMDLAEELLKYVIKYALDKNAEDIGFLTQRLDDEEKQKPQNERSDMSLVEKLQFCLDNSFERLTYTEAIDILKESAPNKKKKFQYPIEGWGTDLQSEHERYLVEKHFKKPVILTDYPKQIKAFYMRQNDPDANGHETVRAMDILFPGIGEIVGGSQREERLEKLEQRMDEMGIPKDELWWYLDTRRFGACPHAGFGLGFERLVQFVTGMGNIRDVIPFPRFPKNAEF